MMMSAWVVTGHPVTSHRGQIFLQACVEVTLYLCGWEEAYYVGNAHQLPRQMNGPECAKGLQALWVLLATVILVF